MFEIQQRVVIHSTEELPLLSKHEGQVGWILNQPFKVHHPDYWTVILKSGTEIFCHFSQINTEDN